MSRLSAFIAIGLFAGMATFLSYASPVRSAPLTSSQLVQRSAKVLGGTLSGHSQSTVHVAGRESIAASVSIDCTVTRTGAHFQSAMRSEIRGDHSVGFGPLEPINMHYIFLESGSTNGKTRSAFWQRDAATTNRWRKTLTVEDPAYTAWLESGGCPAAARVFRIAQGMPDLLLHPPVLTKSAGRRVWAVSGTSGPAAERFSFRLLIDRANYRLDGYNETYKERSKGRIIAKDAEIVTYSKFGSHFSINAPKAGST